MVLETCPFCKGKGGDCPFCHGRGTVNDPRAVADIEGKEPFEGIWDGIRDFNDRFFPGWETIPLVYYSNALAGETGEVCGVVKKMIGGGTRGDGKKLDDLKAEMADVFIYLSLLVMTAGLTYEQFGDAIVKKMAVNEERMQARGVNRDLAGNATSPSGNSSGQPEVQHEG